MIKMTQAETLAMFYGTAYDYLRKHPDFDGRPRPGTAGLTRVGVEPSNTKAWPGVADVHRRTRDQWVADRLEAVRRGDEEPALRQRQPA